MGDITLRDVKNFRRLSERLITGGQPSEEQLVAAAHAGMEVVINLALHDAPYSLPDERGTVEALGMQYEHIPVIWEHPTRADLDTFFATMNLHITQSVFLHCAANMRASAFIMLFRVLCLGWRVEEALPDLQAIWNPVDYPAWDGFIGAALASSPGSERSS